MKVLGAVLAIGLLAGCSTTSKVTADARYSAWAAYGAALQAATAYTDLPRCPGPLVCSDPATVAKLRTADDAAYAALVAGDVTASAIQTFAALATSLGAK